MRKSKLAAIRKSQVRHDLGQSRDDSGRPELEVIWLSLLRRLKRDRDQAKKHLHVFDYVNTTAQPTSPNAACASYPESLSFR